MRSFLLYVALVGVPLLGLLMILRIGERLEAPPYVGGIWTMEPSTVHALKQSCSPPAASVEHLELTVSQSGRYVQVRFTGDEETSLSGRIQAGTLTAHSVVEAGARCGPMTTAVLQLTVRRLPGGEEQLAGSWELRDCDECLPTPILAVRPDAQAAPAPHLDPY